MKGIILAGGSGTRLSPMTDVVSKQLLPIYDKPMIYYPLSTLMLAGIRDVLIISTPQDLGRFEKLLKNGSQIGMNFKYAEQSKPEGIAQAFLIGEDFIENDSSCLILGDNLFSGNGLSGILKDSTKLKEGGLVFGYHVTDPQRYGIVEFDKDGKALSIKEKPKETESNYAVTGLYFYDNKVIDIAKNLQPSKRGELEITDINNEYLKRGKLKVVKFDRGIVWLDTGTPEALLEATNYVHTMQGRQGLKIGCIEEIAFREGFIGKEQLRELAKPLRKTSYGEYLFGILNE